MDLHAVGVKPGRFRAKRAFWTHRASSERLPFAAVLLLTLVALVMGLRSEPSGPGTFAVGSVFALGTLLYLLPEARRAGGPGGRRRDADQLTGGARRSAVLRAASRSGHEAEPVDTPSRWLHHLAMATPRSDGAGLRQLARRQAVVSEALDHAVDVMTELGVGGLTISEVARRTGMRGPSLYKYFPSLHALYDALFARGLAAETAAVKHAMEGHEPGLPRLRAGASANVRWCIENPALAQLLHWRAVPGFEPSPETFAASVEDVRELRAEFAEAVRRRHLAPGADSEDAVRLYTVVLSGLISQQLANQPGAGFEAGVFTRLTDEALDLFFDHYRPRRH